MISIPNSILDPRLRSAELVTVPLNLYRPAWWKVMGRRKPILWLGHLEPFLAVPGTLLWTPEEIYPGLYVLRSQSEVEIEERERRRAIRLHSYEFTIWCWRHVTTGECGTRTEIREISPGDDR